LARSSREVVAGSVIGRSVIGEMWGKIMVSQAVGEGAGRHITETKWLIAGRVAVDAAASGTMGVAGRAED
jgi:hypothetical protein